MVTTILCLLVLFPLINFTHGKRGFDIYLESVNCTANPKFIVKSDCHIDTTPHKQGRLFLDFETINDIPKFTLSLEVYIVRSATENFSLLNLKNSDGCAFVDKKSDVNLVNIYRETLEKAGELPKCPLLKGTHVVFKDLGIDVDKFPPYLPEASFTLIAEFKRDNEFTYWLQLNGSVVQKRKMG